MDFFDKLGKKATETYKATAEKTSKIAKGTKLKIKMGELKSEVSDLYEEIGKKVYEKHELGKKSIDFEKDLNKELTKLEEVTKQIAQINEECLTLKDKKRCSKCNKEIEDDAKFCPNCGEKQEVQEAKKVEVVEDKKQSKQEDTSKKENKKEDKKKETEKQNKDEKSKKELEKTVEIESNVKKAKKNENKN